MTELMYKLFSTGLIALFLTLVLTPIVARLLTKYGVVDKPSGRRINKIPIPRGGGVAIVISWLVAINFAWFFLGFNGLDSLDFRQLTTVFSAIAFLFVVGFFDDLFSLNPFVKLVCQIIVAVLAYQAGFSVGNLLIFKLPPWLNCIATIFWFLIIINAFNLIDGLDGLASGLAFISAMGLSIIMILKNMGEYTVPLFALMGATLGFFRYNSHPASIYLGDSGSLFLGFILALVSLTGGKTAFVSSLAIPLIILGVPIFDTMLAIWRRTMRALLSHDKNGIKQIFLPDMVHLHHRLLNGGLSQRKAALFLYLLAIILVLTAVGVTLFRSKEAGIVIIGLLLFLSMLSRHISNVELWYTGGVFRDVFKSKFARIMPVFHSLSDIIMCIVCWYLAAKFIMPKYPSCITLNFIKIFPVILSSILILFILFKIYLRDWNHSRLLDYIVLSFAAILGIVIGSSVVTICFNQTYSGFWHHIIVFTLLITPILIASRSVRVILYNFMKHKEDEMTKTTNALALVVYGAGEHFASFNSIRTKGIFGAKRYSIVGIIDDDPMVKNRYIHGYPVKGGIEILDSLVAKTGANGFLMLTKLPEERKNTVNVVAKKYNLNVYKLELTPIQVYPNPNKEDDKQ